MALKDAELKPVDTAQIRELGVVEMRDELHRLEEAQFRLKYRAATADVTDGNPLRFRILRRNIARLKTILRETESHG